MILKPEYIRNVRPIAENINDTARLYPYIAEAENLRLIDAIGASLYQWLDENDFSGAGPFQFNNTEITKDQYNALMNGGYFTKSKCCGEGKSVGLITAIAYIAYSRFVVNNPINTTAFGVRYKDGEFSSKVEDAVLIRNSNEARKIGEAYLQQVVEHCRSLELLPCSNQYVEAPKRIIRISRQKL